MKKKFVLVLLSFILLFPIAFSEVYSNEEFEYTVNENGTVDILYFIGASEDIIIPDTLENLPVTNIDDCAFFSISSLKTVVIPEGVTSIKWMAFSGCENLTAVVIPDSVTEIDSSAFSSCDKLTLIVNPDSYAEAYCSENNLPYDYELSSELAETPVEPVEEENKAEDNSTETPIETQTASLYEPPIPIENGAIYQAESDPHFKYVVNTDGTITVTEFVSKACTELGCDCKGITVPSVLDKHMVTGLSMFYTWPEFLEIPETIIYIDDRTLLGACMEFRVSPFNPVYTSMNGVLYNRLTRSLIRSPMQTSDYVPDAFSIPNGTLSIGDNAFLWTSYSNVLIPDSVVSIGKGAFDGIVPTDKAPADVRGDQLAAVGFAVVKHQGAAVQNGLGELPNMVLRIGELPQGGVCQAFLPAVKFWLVPRTKGGIGHPGFCVHNAPEQVVPAEKHPVPGRERGGVDTTQRAPGSGRGAAVVLVVSIGADIISGAGDIGGVRRFENCLPAAVGCMFKMLQQRSGCFFHVGSSERWIVVSV